MKTLALFIIGALMATESLDAQESKTISTKKQKISYGIGREMGRNIRQQGADVDLNALLKGMKDGVSNAKPAIAEEEIQTLLEAYGREMMEKQTSKAKEQGDKNKKTGEAFLAANMKKDGVTTLPNGIQYRIVKAGNGPKPTKEKTVVCHYRGTLTDGTEFDSSIKRNEPATFPVGNVIQGWQEILPMMPVGSKWEVVIPSNLGYGERGTGGTIGPNATLIFEIELLSIQ
jgi:FKBP-type peptidyl-prolyl cis-trans isomerase FklB